MNPQALTPQRVIEVGETLAHVHGKEYAKRAEQAAALMSLIGSVCMTAKAGDTVVSSILADLLALTSFKLLPEIACVSAADFKTASLARASDCDDLQEIVRKEMGL